MKGSTVSSGGEDDTKNYQNRATKSLISDLHFVDAQDIFIQIHQRAKTLGLSQNQLRDLHHVKLISNARKIEQVSKFVKSAAFIAILLLSIYASWTINWPLSSKDLAKVWLQIRGDNPKSSEFQREKCLIKASNRVQDLARPLIDCDFCANVREVVRVKELSVEEFQEGFAYSGQPIVVQDGAANWSALNEFNFKFFRDIYGHDSLALKNTEAQCQFFPYKTEFKNLGQVFLMDEKRALLNKDSPPWYIGWSNCDAAAGNLLRSHYTKPYFLPSESESSKTDWIFMGSPGYGAHMHVDHVTLPSWQAQIQGHKQWSLQVPPECYGSCGNDLSVTVHPGEIIVLDTNKWYHSTLIVGDYISITIGSEYD